MQGLTPVISRLGCLELIVSTSLLAKGVWRSAVYNIDIGVWFIYTLRIGGVMWMDSHAKELELNPQGIKHEK